MKILLASSSSGSRGGGEIAILYLGIGLARLGHEVVFWASDAPHMDELCERFSEVGKVYRDPYTNTYRRRFRTLSAPWSQRKSALKIASYWEKIAPDIIHINKQNLEDGLDLLAASEILCRPSTCMIHITQSAKFLKAKSAGLRDSIARKGLKEYSGVLLSTPQNRVDELSAFLGGRNVETVTNGVDHHPRKEHDAWREAKRKKLNLADDEPLIVAVGRLVPQKDPEAFLHAAKALHQKLPRAHFAWVGDGIGRVDFLGQAKALELEARVHVTGWENDPKPWLSAADIFMHCAEFEGLPFAILEGLAAGLPTAISQNLLAELPPLQHDGVHPIDRKNDWCDRLANPAARKIDGEACRRLHKEAFSLEAMAASFESAFQQAKTLDS